MPPPQFMWAAGPEPSLSLSWMEKPNLLPKTGVIPNSLQGMRHFVDAAAWTLVLTAISYTEESRARCPAGRPPLLSAGRQSVCVPLPPAGFCDET